MINTTTAFGGPRDLPILWSFLKDTKDQVSTVLLGLFFRAELHKDKNTFTAAEMKDDLYGMFNTRTIAKRLSKLKSLDLLESVELDPYFVKQQFWKDIESPFGPHCTWCKKLCNCLHRHHWPLTEKQGGVEIIKICPECHIAYHAKVRVFRYKASNKLLTIFQDTLKEHGVIQ